MTDDPLAKYHILIESGSLIIDSDAMSAIIKEPRRGQGFVDDYWDLICWGITSVEIELQRLGYKVEIQLED